MELFFLPMDEALVMVSVDISEEVICILKGSLKEKI